MLRIIGIGQSLRGDDSVGLVAVQHWLEEFPITAKHPSVQVDFVELPGLNLVDSLAGADQVILVDAVRSGSPPGTIHRLRQTDLASFSNGSDSAHGWGIAETLDLVMLLYPEELPGEIVIIGIEASDLRLGSQLSSSISEAIDQIAKAIEESAKILLGKE